MCESKGNEAVGSASKYWKWFVKFRKGNVSVQEERILPESENR